jgi:hypothetical protein
MALADARAYRGGVNLKAALCVPVGHKWHPVESDTPYPLLKCDRCGRLRELTTESSGAEGWSARGARSAAMREMMDDPSRRR